jgi:hypothetical protein
MGCTGCDSKVITASGIGGELVTIALLSAILGSTVIWGMNAIKYYRMHIRLYCLYLTLQKPRN